MLSSHKKLVDFEIDYTSKESADKESDQVNKDELETKEGRKSDIKSTRKAARTI